MCQVERVEGYLGFKCVHAEKDIRSNPNPDPEKGFLNSKIGKFFS